MSVNQRCRFCHANLKVHGVFSNCTKIFYTKGKAKSIFYRLVALGLTLTETPEKSIRMCKHCANLLARLERDVPVFRRWGEEETRPCSDETTRSSTAAEPPEPSSGEPSSGEPSSEPSAAADQRKWTLSPRNPGALNKYVPHLVTPSRPLLSMSGRRSVTEVVTHYPSNKTVVTVCDPAAAGIVTNINKKHWRTAASLIMKHQDLLEEVKLKVLLLVQRECKTLCNPNKGFMLWRSTAEDLEAFSLSSLESDLGRLSPFLLSVLSTAADHSRPPACAAAAIALRGREPRLSAFAYHLNGILKQGGARKAVFQRLSKMAITTTHSRALGKQRELARSTAVPAARSAQEQPPPTHTGGPPGVQGGGGDDGIPGDLGGCAGPSAAVVNPGGGKMAV